MMNLFLSSEFFYAREKGKKLVDDAQLQFFTFSL